MILRRNKRSLQIAVCAGMSLSSPAANAQNKIAPDAGKFIVSIQDNVVATDTFTTDADSGSECDVSLTQGAATLKLHMSVQAKQGRTTGITTDAHPGGKFALDAQGDRGRLTIFVTPPRVSDVTLPARFYAYAGVLAPNLLANIVAAYDRSRGGTQTFSSVLANGLGPKGLVQDRITLTALGAQSRQINGKAAGVIRYSLGVPSPVGQQEMELAVDADGRVLMLSMATQKLYAVRDGYQALLASETPSDPTLSKSTYAVKKETGVKIAMRDGVQLVADVYRPDTPGRFPVILQRTPYGRDKAFEATAYAKRGYVFVAQDVRGKFDSEGEWKPFVNEARDGYDSVEWCATQPWAQPSVGMIGGSYLGFVQWAAARENPPHLKCLIPIVSPPDPFYNIPYAFGTLFLWPDIWWTAIVEGRGMNAIPKLTDIAPFKTLPVSDVDKAILGHHVAFFQEWLKHNTDDAYWQQVDFNAKMPALPAIPALHISGWFDGDGIGTKRNYAAMTRSGQRNQRLVYGPWTHAVNTSTKIGKLDFGPQSVRDLDTLYLRWFDHWLKGVANGVEAEKPVDAFLMGRNEWRQFTAWPPAEADMTRWYFHSNGHANADKSDGRLTMDKPSASEKPDHFRYDPAHPLIPAAFESALKAGGDIDASTGAEPQTRDPQALVYTSDALPKDVVVAGPIDVHLSAATTARDTDWYAVLEDVGLDGQAQQLCQGIVRARFRSGYQKAAALRANQTESYVIDLWATGNVFRAGHKIRVTVSSSCFPFYDRNLNTGDNNATTTRMVTAQQTVHHDAAHVSYIVLPEIREREKREGGKE